MTIEIKHPFTSTKSDGPDETQVQGSDWNAGHLITMATARLLGRTTAGAGDAEEISVGPGLTLGSGVLDTKGVRQVVQGSTMTSVTISSTSYTATGLSASITPASTASRVLVLVSQAFWLGRSTTTARAGFRIVRGSTEILEEANFSQMIGMDDSGATFATYASRYAAQWVDSPATASSVTYSVQGRLETTANSAVLEAQNFGESRSVITLLELAP